MYGRSPMHKLNSEIILYHTDGCHLCDIAQEQLQALELDFKLVDICEDEELAEKYGIRIPVLLKSTDASELGWPFDADDVIKFLGV